MVKFSATAALLLSAVLVGLMASDTAAQAPPAQPPVQPPVQPPNNQNPARAAPTANNQNPARAAPPVSKEAEMAEMYQRTQREAAQLIARARNGTMVKDTPIECQMAMYNERTLQPCNPSPANRNFHPSEDTACNGAPRDGKPGHFCSDDEYIAAMKELQAKCAEQLKNANHPASKQYGLFYILPLNANIRCTKHAATNEWCSEAENKEAPDTAPDAPCNDCKRQRLQQIVDWKRPASIPEPVGNPTVEMILNPDDEDLAQCGVKRPGDAANQQSSESSAHRIFQQATGVATGAAVLSATLMFGLLSLI